MTAMVFTSELKQFFDIHPLIHLCTFGGHDVGCRVAAAALDEYEQIKPWQNAKVQGAKIMNELKSAMASDDRIKSLNGLGLLISLLFSSAETANRFCFLASKNGILLHKGIVDCCCVLIRPSLLITEGEVEIINQGIRATMKDL